MTETPAQTPKPFLYVIVCAAGIASDVSKLITAAQERDWEVGVIATSLALGTLCEVYGLGVPIAVLPCVGDALAAHPAYRASLERLRGMGVRFADPYAGEAQDGGGRPEFGWERGLELLGTR